MNTPSDIKYTRTTSNKIKNIINLVTISVWNVFAAAEQNKKKKIQWNDAVERWTTIAEHTIILTFV